MEDKLSFLALLVLWGPRDNNTDSGLTTSLNVHGSKNLHTKPTTVPSYNYIFLPIKIQTLGTFLGTFACGVLFLPPLVGLLNCGRVTCPVFMFQPANWDVIDVIYPGRSRGGVFLGP